MRYRQALRRRRTAPRRWSLTAAHRRELGISAVDAAFCPSITAVVCFRPNIVRQVQFRLLHLDGIVEIVKAYAPARSRAISEPGCVRSHVASVVASRSGRRSTTRLADHLAVLHMQLRHCAQCDRHLVRALTLLSALAMVTERIGLVATTSCRQTSNADRENRPISRVSNP